ncbi:DNA-directed RNA polymerase subunit beta [Patescibacteria group bacterium]|nr:DNA-directed RNA polymerase subunit beta [Patescibacteria group bacterium]MBU1868512.1 DNA-directed RNA polymerase subunit beta [Patescibacteria group bacterium]
MGKKLTRINVGQVGSRSSVAIPDLIQLQKSSYEQFLNEGLAEVLSRVSPITDYAEETYSLKLFNPSIKLPSITPEEAIQKGTSYEVKIFAKAELADLETGEVVEQEVFLGAIPQITERATFIINGVERCVVSQLTRAPGVYFESERHPSLGRNLYSAAIRPERGAWLELLTYRGNEIFARINQKARFPVTALLKALGLRHSELRKRFSDVDVEPLSYIQQTIKKDPGTTQEEALLEVYTKTNPGDPRILENAESFFKNSFLNARYFSLGTVGRYKVNKRLGLNFPVEKEFLTLQAEDVVESLRELIRLNVEQLPADNIDHLSNRRVRFVGELVQNSFERGVRMLERNVQERLSLASMDKPMTPIVLVNSRPIVARIREFFGTSRLSQYMDQANPLSEIEHLRRISALGPGGLTRERAGPAVRDVQPSHYGRLCIVKTPEGQNIGLNLSIALFAQCNEYGFLETPYLKVEQRDDGAYVTEQMEFLSADEEEKYRIAESTVSLDEKGKITDKTVTVRYRSDFVFAPVSRVDYVDLYPSQVLGISAALIPFMSSDVGNRALMGANMQCQAVPLIIPRTSRVGTGVERKLIEDSQWGIFAEEAGVIDYVDADEIKVNYKNKKKTYHLTKYMRTNDNSCYNQTPCVQLGQKVGKGEALIDGPSHEGGELALGRDLLVAFMAWDGFNYEDSLVISERIVRDDLLTSIHIKSYEAMVMETKLGPEEVTPDIPNISAESLRNLDETGIIVGGAQVKPGDVLVGKVAPKGELELTAEERLLRAIFGEKAREVRNTSLIMPHGERGRVISITVLTKEDVDELPPGVLKMIRVQVAQLRKVREGDKLSGRHGSKGVVARIVPDEDMPYMGDGTVVDIILNPISILGRMNIGQMKEAHLGWAGVKLGEYYAITAFDKLPQDLIASKFKEAGLPETGKMTLYDGRTGIPFEHPIAVGYAHVMKLHHLVEDKIHARSTGPYSLITQQPLGGKAQMGGQRLGEMEVWALEAYGAAHTLQEMLTIKSDDVVGRAKAFEAIIKGEPIPEARVPESFKLLVKELNALALDIQPLKLSEIDAEEE